WFRRHRSGRARDFNWHNTVGIWCAPVVVVLTATGVVMSYPWANNLLYRLAGSEPPQQQAAGGARPDIAGGGRAPASSGASEPSNLDAAWALAEARVPTWRSITMRLPARGTQPLSLSIVDARSWNQFAR